ncbi:MAG: hypothetical protein WDZ51_09395 [Pirellulaceae bacterium]
MNRNTHRRITHLWLTCSAGALAGFAVLTDMTPTSAQGPTASRWSSAPVEQPVNPATAPPRTYRVGDQAPGPTRLSSNPARPSLTDAQRISEPPEEAHLVRLPPVDDEPVASRSVTDDSNPAQPEVQADPTPEQVAKQTAPSTPPAKPEPRRPANRIDWNHPQVVIGPAQPAGTPIPNQHVARASGEAEDFFSFDPTRGELSADSAETPSATPASATEAPNQFAQGYEKGSVKAHEIKTPPQRELSPITACRILGLKPATERR